MDQSGEARLPELKLDSRQAQGFISFFRSLPQDGNTLRFFDRKEYFTVHGPAALFVARSYYKTMSAVRQLGSGSDGLPSVTVNNNMFESVVRDTLLSTEGAASDVSGAGDAGAVPSRFFAVEVYEGSGSSWRVVKSGTPGKLGEFEDVLFGSADMADSPTVLAVMVASKESERRVGIAFMDLTRRTVGVTEFLDDDQFTNLEAAVVALGGKECVLPQEQGKLSPEAKRVRDVMSRCDVAMTERKKTEFRPRDAESDLRRLVKGPGATAGATGASGASIESELAASALAALLAYTDVLGDNSNYGKFMLLPYSLGTHMRLDATALRALNITESKADISKTSSLAGLLNRTCTAGMGRRLLNRWIKQPLVDPEAIRERLDVVQAFVDSAMLRQEARMHLKRMPDIERLTRKLETRKANLQDVVKLYQASVRLPFLRDVLSEHGGEFVDVLKEKYVDGMSEWCSEDHLAKYEGLVEAAVDLEELERGECLIAPSYDPSLAEIKAEREEVEGEVMRALGQAASDLGLVVDKTLKVDRTTQNGFVFRITKKEETNVRKKLAASFVTLETRKDGVKFTNPKLKQLSDRHIALCEAYADTQRELVIKVVEVAGTFVEVFERVAALVAELDVLQSFAELSVSAPTPYVRPSISGPDEGDIVLEACRHPCVEVQDDVSFIANDCRLVRGKSWFQIITGPNMGGKSTFIRQVGVNVLMAQIGCFVPCDRAHVSIRDAIFARVGAGDCQLRGVSTFMAEMLETASILKAATPRSLVIIDELGRGTSTYDGFGLAWAICEHLVDVTKAPTLFATHFHELTALANRDTPGDASSSSTTTLSGIANFHVSAHIDERSRKLTMLYQVEPGPCDQSFGIHVAEFARFPPEVVEMARKKAEQLEDFSPASLSGSLTQGDAAGKRKRVAAPEEREKGTERARRFLKEFAALPLATMEPDEAMKATSQLVEGLKKDARDMPWLEGVLESLEKRA